MYSESKRIEYLDSIRGLAALFVLFYHTLSAFSWPAGYNWVASWPMVNILFDGRGAVCMFFVLSGYILSKPYIATAENPSPRNLFLPTFYLRRFTRIWLPWFFVFILSLLVRKYLFSQPLTDPPVTPWLAQYWHSALTVGDFFRQCVFLLHDGTRQLVPQDWSLCVELRGSLLMPLFIYLLSPRRLWFLFALALMFVLFGGLAYHYDSFVVGVLLARYGEKAAAWCQCHGRPVRTLILVVGLAAYQLNSLIFARFPEGGLLPACGWIAGSLGCGLVLMACFSSRSLQGFLGQRPVVFLGRISYSVYLFQLMAILSVLPWVVWLANECGVVNRPALLGLAFLASISVTIGCAALAYRFIEVPAINLGHRWTRKLQGAFQRS